MEPLGILIPQLGTEIPIEPHPFYIATQKGWIINTPTLFGQARVLTKEAPTVLPEVKENFILNGEKLPLYILRQFHDLARKNFAANKAECSAYITYSDVSGDYGLFIPEQYVTHTSVNHKLDAGAIRGGYRAIGTIHSHCDFSAFHSGTDKHDMGKMPGLHITIGHVDRPDPEFVFALSVGEAQFDVTREQIIDELRPLNRHGYDTAPDRWLGFIHTGRAPWTNGITTSFYRPATPSTPTYKRGYTPTYNQRNWDDWDWDTADLNMRKYTPPTLMQDRLEQVDAFKEFEEEIEESEAELEATTAELAFIGFCLNYNITFNPKRATAWLMSHKIYTEEEEDENEQYLLPEGKNK